MRISDDTKGTLFGLFIMGLLMWIGIVFVIVVGNASQDSVGLIEEDFISRDIEPLDVDEDVIDPDEPLGPEEQIELVSVNDFEATATATRSYNTTQYVLMITAQLNEPPEGRFYEAWLSGRNTAWAGSLNKESDNSYTLELVTSEDYSEYSTVFITEEREPYQEDSVPQKHVLEGTFN